jgi:hypothetical protein
MESIPLPLGRCSPEKTLHRNSYTTSPKTHPKDVILPRLYRPLRLDGMSQYAREVLQEIQAQIRFFHRASRRLRVGKMSESAEHDCKRQSDTVKG